MQNDTKIYVSKKAADIVDKIEEIEVDGKRVYSCTFIDGSRIDDTSYLQMQKRIAQINKVNRDGIITAAEKKREEEAAIAARAEAITAAATKVEKVNYSESNVKKNADRKAAAKEARKTAYEKAKAKAEAANAAEPLVKGSPEWYERKRINDRKYRERHLEAVRKRDREYRRKKRAAEKAQGAEQ